MIDREEFFDVIFGEIGGGEHVCVSRASTAKGGRVWFANHLEGDRQWCRWNAEKQGQAWYYNVSTVSGALTDRGTMVSRGRAALRYYYVLVLDDIYDKTGPPPVWPSYRMETSPGSEQWGYCLEKGDDFARYEALLEAIHKKGWGDAGAGGSYRVVRVPGSANLKPGRGEFRSRLKGWSPQRYWALESLAVAFGVDLDAIPIKEFSVVDETGGAGEMDGVDVLLDWLVGTGYVVRDTGGEWVSVICPWADTHTSGDNTAGYSPLGRGRAGWVQTRGFRCLHEHCLSRDYKAFSVWGDGKGAPIVPGRDDGPWLGRGLAALAESLNMKKGKSDD